MMASWKWFAAMGLVGTILAPACSCERDCRDTATCESETGGGGVGGTASAAGGEGGLGDGGSGAMGTGGSGGGEQIVAPVAIGAGAAHTCVALSDGSVWCWGSNFAGQLGEGSFGYVTGGLERSTVPIQTMFEDAGNVVVGGGNHTCATKDDGTAWCWGRNEFGQLGDGTEDDRALPVAVSTLSGVETLSASFDHTCAVAGGQVKCWGLGETAQLGDGNITDASVPVDAAVGPSSDVATIDGSSCAVLDSGSVSCWGAGPLGNGSAQGSLTPVTVSGISNASMIAGGAGHFCVLQDGGAVSCWGDNQNKQVNNSTNTPILSPAQGAASAFSALEIGLGNAHSCVLSNDEVACWGMAELQGQLVDVGTAFPIAGLAGETPTHLAVGGSHACVITDMRNVYCWGMNDEGQLGDGTTAAAVSAVKVQATWQIPD